MTGSYSYSDFNCLPIYVTAWDVLYVYREPFKSLEVNSAIWNILKNSFNKYLKNALARNILIYVVIISAYPPS